MCSLLLRFPSIQGAAGRDNIPLRFMVLPALHKGSIDNNVYGF